MFDPQPLVPVETGNAGWVGCWPGPGLLTPTRKSLAASGALLLTLLQKPDNGSQMKLRLVRNLKSILILMSKNNRVEELQIVSSQADNGDANAVSGSPSRVIQSSELFGVENEIGIVHQGSMYRLRVTRGGKLILNK